MKKEKGKIIQTKNFKFRSKQSKEIEYFDKNSKDKQWILVNTNSLKHWLRKHRLKKGK